MSILRYAAIGLGAAAIVGLFGSQISQLEGIKADGKRVWLDLRPVDPRALMMGDFMALGYQEETNRALPKDLPSSGQFILKLDENNVGTFARLGDDAVLADHEVRINYIRRRRGVTFGAPRYYFQNGTAKTYEPADYGIFKISKSGRAVLVGLADENFEEILPPED